MNKLTKHNRSRFTQAEGKFLSENEVCRISTSHDDMPHVVPVAYIYDEDAIAFVTDYGTRKYRNLEYNKKVSVVVDTYNPSGENKGIVIQGKVDIIEKGDEYKRLYQIFDSRFEWVRNNPWGEGEAPFVKVNPFNKVSWGI